MLTSIVDFQHAHPAITALGSYMVFSALVSGMPEPTVNSSTGYMWAYRTLHIMAANVDKIWAAKTAPGGTFAQTTTTVVTSPPADPPQAKEK